MAAKNPDGPDLAYDIQTGWSDQKQLQHGRKLN